MPKSVLKLYGTYDEPEVLRLFGSEQVRRIMRGAIIGSSRWHAWFVTLDPKGAGSHFARPDELTWKATTSFSKSDRPPEEWLSNIDLLVRGDRSGPYTYVGRTEIHPMAMLDDTVVVVRPKLRRDVLTRLSQGQARKWNVHLDGREVPVAAPGGATVVIESLKRAGPHEMSITRYEGDILHAVFNAGGALVTYHRDSDDPGLRAVPRDAKAGVASGTTALRLPNGQVDRVPTAATLPRTEAIDLVAQFLQHGKRPSSVRWVRAR